MRRESAVVTAGWTRSGESERVANVLDLPRTLLEFLHETLYFDGGIVRVSPTTDEGVQVGQVRIEQSQEGTRVGDERSGVAVSPSVAIIVIARIGISIQCQIRGIEIRQPLREGRDAVIVVDVVVLPLSSTLMPLLRYPKGGASGGEEFDAPIDIGGGFGLPLRRRVEAAAVVDVRCRRKDGGGHGGGWWLA